MKNTKTAKTMAIVCRICGTRHEVDPKAVCFHCNGCSHTFYAYYDYTTPANR